MTAVAESTIALSAYNAIVAFNRPVRAQEITRALRVVWMPVGHDEVCGALGALLDRRQVEVKGGLFDVVGRDFTGARKPVRMRDRSGDGWWC